MAKVKMRSKRVVRQERVKQVMQQPAGQEAWVTMAQQEATAQ
jgi:hypothetical protein